MCVAGGERVHRHYAVRDLLFSWAEKAGLHPEKERPGLFLPQTPEDVQSGRRRPADVFLPALAGVLLHLISPSRRISDRIPLPWPVARLVQLLSNMLVTRSSTSTLQKHVPSKGYLLYPWSAKLRDIGKLAQPACFGMWRWLRQPAAKRRQGASITDCYRSFAWWSVRFELGLLCGGELS